MSEKPESDGYDEEEASEAAEDTDALDVDHLLKGMDSLKRRAPKGGDPAWRRLERYREKKLTEELLSDFDDYDIGTDDGESPQAASGKKKKKH